MTQNWPTDAAEARALQRHLADRIVERDELGEVETIAGVDVHYSAGRNLAFAAAALLDAGSLELIESVLLAAPVRFPYRTGLLSFREAPAALEALRRLSRRPDLLFVDGQGRAHPRRLGIAAHIGLLADLPTIGVAKSRLVGRHAEPPADAGAAVPLMDKNEVIGTVLRTRARGRPLYVSIGHRISLATATRLTLACARGYRLPEPTRVADALSRAHR